MTETKRAERRHHVARLNETRRKHQRNIGIVKHGTERQVAFNLKNPVSCSCPACGSQRKYAGETLQEVRAGYALGWDRAYDWNFSFLWVRPDSDYATEPDWDDDYDCYDPYPGYFYDYIEENDEQGDLVHHMKVAVDLIG